MATATATAFTPFSCSPDPTVLLFTASIRAVEYKTRYTIEHRQGLAAILGDPGLGKSTILRHFHAKYAATPNCLSLLIPTPSFSSPFALLKTIATSFGCPGKRSMLEQQPAFEDWLTERYSESRNVIVLIDEAQRLPPDQLEVIRTLLNFESDREKLIQIVLAGNLDLRDKLLQKRHKPLLSRVFAPSMLTAMTPEEMAEMLRVRCGREAIPFPFHQDALKALYDYSSGIPRIVLKVAEFAYAQMRDLSLESITAPIVEAIAAEFRIEDEQSAESV